MAKKVEAGADFIQTNYIFDVPKFEKFMDHVRAKKLHKKVYILAGVGPLVSAKAGRWMRTNVPGIHIPDSIIERLENAENQSQEGKNIAVELVKKMRQIEGVSGVHIMAYRREHKVNEIIEKSGVLSDRFRDAAYSSNVG